MVRSSFVKSAGSCLADLISINERKWSGSCGDGAPQRLHSLMHYSLMHSACLGKISASVVFQRFFMWTPHYRSEVDIYRPTCVEDATKYNSLLFLCCSLSTDRSAGVHRVEVNRVLEWKPQPLTRKCVEAGKQIVLWLFWICDKNCKAPSHSTAMIDFAQFRIRVIQLFLALPSQLQQPNTKWDETEQPYFWLLPLASSTDCNKALFEASDTNNLLYQETKSRF